MYTSKSHVDTLLCLKGLIFAKRHKKTPADICCVCRLSNMGGNLCFYWPPLTFLNGYLIHPHLCTGRVHTSGLDRRGYKKKGVPIKIEAPQGRQDRVPRVLCNAHPQAGSWAGQPTTSCNNVPHTSRGLWAEGGYFQIKHNTQKTGCKSRAASLQHTANSKGSQEGQGRRDKNSWEGNKGTMVWIDSQEATSIPVSFLPAAESDLSLEFLANGHIVRCTKIKGKYHPHTEGTCSNFLQGRWAVASLITVRECDVPVLFGEGWLGSPGRRHLAEPLEPRQSCF